VAGLLFEKHLEGNARGGPGGAQRPVPQPEMPSLRNETEYRCTGVSEKSLNH
jgi:hypothetical protein